MRSPATTIGILGAVATVFLGSDAMPAPIDPLGASARAAATVTDETPSAALEPALADETDIAATERDSTLMYSCTGGTMTYAPGLAVYIADDLRMATPCDCDVTAYSIGVDGGGDGTGTFSAQVALLDDCPDEGGEVIPGTSTTFPYMNDGGQTVLTVDLSSSPVTVPRNAWLRVRFNTSSAGVVAGEPAEVGFSVNGYWHPSGTCISSLGVHYAAFHAQVYCDSDLAPPAPADPSPPDGASDVSLSTELAWDGAAQTSDTSPAPLGSAEDETAIRAIVDDVEWTKNVKPGSWCATQERYEARLDPADRAPLDGCPVDGMCDIPLVRNLYTPGPDTLVKEVRIAFHVFCHSDGTGCLATAAQVNAQMNLTNYAYEPYRIQFVHETDFIHDSSFRDFEYEEETAMKTLYADSPDTKLNVYLVVSADGWSWGTFPWWSSALTHLGGILLSDSAFGGMILPHEIGHCLGLWHTFHGVDEVYACGPCWEYAGVPGQDNEGDRCSDTPPTPTNYDCAPPGGFDPCNLQSWGVTDYENIMGYGWCWQQHFTTQQAARAHCWTEDILSGWMEEQCKPLYDVYFDTTNPPTTPVCEDLIDPTCAPQLLACDTTYFWHVVATRQDASTTGPVWSFTTIGGGDCNNNGTPDLCEIELGIGPDCNDNLIPDECEVPPIDPGGSDCNGNSRPDECEVPPIDPDGDDCNANARPDECDLADGTSSDRFPPAWGGDGVPDECQTRTPVPH